MSKKMKNTKILNIVQKNNNINNKNTTGNMQMFLGFYTVAWFDNMFKYGISVSVCQVNSQQRTEYARF